MYVMITCAIVHEPYTLTREELVDKSFQLVRRASAETHEDAMLGFDQRFFESFLEQLVSSALLQVDSEGRVEPSPKLIVIQQRSTVGVESEFRTRLQNYLVEDR